MTPPLPRPAMALIHTQAEHHWILPVHSSVVIWERQPAGVIAHSCFVCFSLIRATFHE